VLRSSFACLRPLTHQDLGANIFTGLHCEPNPVFLQHTYTFPHFFFLPADYQNFSITMAPMQIHGVVFATFASLIAPFGGFFASGLKRTFKIKDFGHSIPGHGGMTDRMDCQFIMGFFAYIYFHTFIAINKVNLGSVMEDIITGLTADEIVELVLRVVAYLTNQGLIDTEVCFGRFSHVATRRTRSDTCRRFCPFWKQSYPPKGEQPGVRVMALHEQCKVLPLTQRGLRLAHGVVVGSLFLLRHISFAI